MKIIKDKWQVAYDYGDWWTIYRFVEYIADELETVITTKERSAMTLRSKKDAKALADKLNELEGKEGNEDLHSEGACEDTESISDDDISSRR